MANALYQYAMASGHKLLLFCVSPKRRAMRSAELVRENLATMSSGIRVKIEIDQNLREIDQGEFILPKGYVPGDSFEGLKIGGKIFSAETFNIEDSSKDNLDYHFGDPLLRENGMYRYPKLREYFSASGESYRDILKRFYSGVITLSENMERFGNSIEPVIFTHGQPHQIFSNLADVADKVINEGFTFMSGTLARICWDIYQAKRRNVVPYGQLTFVSLEHVCNPQVIELLKRELEFLKEPAPGESI
ncbi:hypothetical protein H0X32_00435 [Patescibacteria group bacterium]|nr:hypothetical protein [Patescibacteria group bacterium]